MSSTRQTLQRTARLTDVTIGDVIDVPTNTYLRVRAGKIVEWRGIGGDAKPQPERRMTVRTEVPDVIRQQAAKQRRNERRQRRLPGITDLVETHPDDWWAEAERLLADDEGWPTGTAQIKARPRNEWGW